MTTAIIITFSVLLLLAYVFDLTSAKTKIPSVILLLLLGWAVRQITELLNIHLPDFSEILPVLGTIGLILIVLEGSLELELNNSRFGLIRKSFLGALIPMIALAFLLAFAFKYFGNFGLKDSLTNAIPFCVISSAIAIPSVRSLSSLHREFVIYESSFSDILGVLIFNFIALNQTIDAKSFGHFAIQILIITVISLIATVGLSFLLSRIEHHVKFFPIILLLVLMYAIAKIFHLPGLILILIFGLAIGNLDKLEKLRWLKRFNLEVLKKEVIRFKELTFEAAFLIRALFFLLFGYLIETSEVLNTGTLIWALAIVIAIFTFRTIQLRLSGLPLFPLLFIAPRGLISILLFLSIEPAHTISLVNNSLIIQVILLTALLMMFGLMSRKSQEKMMGE
ncbi:MAG TPA: cation:proton antiporter [Bacteroidia bacterium]|nr:cation:proton antiporter [Bacteroidia bacterium]HRS59028.1 cation:proton antiporter [Bacteroidia bacterium]HRU68092.1 cation:proton antiporter [Bacteroidia bacterium]